MIESFKYDKRILKNPKLMESPLSPLEVNSYISELAEIQDQGILMSDLFAQREEAARIAEEEAARIAEEEAARFAEEEAIRLAEEAANADLEDEESIELTEISEFSVDEVDSLDESIGSEEE
jgi:hypothetical protein